MCSLTPSVTLYGTTQVPTVRTLTHTITKTSLGAPQVIEVAITTTQCDILGAICGAQVVKVQTTVVPTITITTTSTEVKSTLATNVVPQKTLYYPCPYYSAEGNGHTESSSQGVDQAPTFNTPEPQPQPTPSPSTTHQSQSAVDDDAPSSSRRIATTTPPFVTSQASSARSIPPSIPSSTTTQSADSITAQPASSGRAAPSPAAASKSNNGAALAGGITGGIIALIILCAIMTYLRRARFPSSSSSRRHSRGTVLTDYWERRFRALEAEADTSQIDITEGLEKVDMEERSPAKKIRLTLDLRSKDMSDRPASRLSTISSFFGISQPIAHRYANHGTLPFAGGRAGSNGSIGFSQPVFISKRFSRGSVSTTRTGKTSRKSPSWKEEDDEPQERSAMEWIRPSTMVATSTNDDPDASTPGLLPTHAPAAPRGVLTRQLTPPRPYQAGTTAQPTDSSRKSSLGSTLSSWSEASSTPPISTANQTSHIPAVRAVSETDYDPTSRTSSYHTTQSQKGKAVPTLPLGREAITPSLWIDEETYDEFRRLKDSPFSPDGSVGPSTLVGSVVEEDVYGGISTVQ